MKNLILSALVGVGLMSGITLATPQITYLSATNEAGASAAGGTTEHDINSDTTSYGVMAEGYNDTTSDYAFSYGEYDHTTAGFSMQWGIHEFPLIANGDSNASLGFEATFTVNEQATAHIDFGFISAYISGSGSNIGITGVLRDMTTNTDVYNYSEGAINSSGYIDAHALSGTITLYVGHTYKWTSQWSISSVSGGSVFIEHPFAFIEL